MPHNVQKHHKQVWHKTLHAPQAAQQQAAIREPAVQSSRSPSDHASIKATPATPSLSETVEKARQAIAQQSQAPKQVIDASSDPGWDWSMFKELSFALQNPSTALAIGTYTPGSTNVATNSARIASGIRLPENEAMQGSHVNALRHALWQATVAVKFGPDVALEVGNAHEKNPDALAALQDPKRVVFNGEHALSRADEIVDLLNNQIGRELGSANPKASSKDLAIKLIEHFKQQGLWIAQQTSEGGYRLQQSPLTAQEYRTAQKALRHMDENGVRTD